DQFINAGDGLLTDFNLYWLGGFISAGSGLIDLEIEFIEVWLNSAGLDGDFNDDGSVDAADYVVWRKNAGTTNTLPNDGGIPGAIGTAHYDLWRANFGQSGGSEAGSAGVVPEPASWLLAVVMACFFTFRRRNK